MSEKSKKEAGRKAAKPRAGVAAAGRNAARGAKKTPVFDDVSPQKKLREALRSLLPRVFAGGRLDIDALCESLGESRKAVARERYRFEWVGRADSVRLLEQNPALALRPCRGESVDFEATRNLYLEGDNLSVLRLLGRAYAGRVKMIYIDPPYNTGKDFVYPDKFGESFAAYEARAGEAESADAREESKRNGANRHSFWLSMMFPRLLLARDLLRDDGVIFVSIDDNEAHHLRLLLNAVFGEENFLAQIAWQGMDTIKNDARYFSTNHEFIFAYAKDLSMAKIKGFKKTGKQRATYKNRDNDPRGDYLLTPLHAKSGSENAVYEYTFPNGQKWSPPNGRYPSYSRERLRQLVSEGRVYLDPEGKTTPQKKTYWNESGDRMRPSTFWRHENFGSTRQSNAELRGLLGRAIFQNPKPVKLVKSIADLVTGGDDIVFDFFAGSSTTAHAVMELNAEDGGKRQCISVQLPEETDEESETRKAGFATIADLGKERLRRAGQKIREAKNGAAETDIGFRVFKIAPAVLRRRVSEEKATRQKRLKTESAEAQLYEIALAEGLSLTAQIEERKIGKNTVHQVSDALNGRRLHICLDSKIAVDFPRKTIAEKGETVICRDDAMSDEIALNLSFHYNLKVL